MQLTEQQRDDILRLVGYHDAGGVWLYAYDDVARQVGTDSQAVSECVREAAGAWGRHTRWHDTTDGEAG
jgi:YD repeat-containing protein